MFAGGLRGKVVFPYYDADGNVVDLRTRSISARDTVGGKPIRYTSPQGPSEARGALVPYGLDALGDAHRVVLTEGEFKALTPRAHGLEMPILALRGINDSALNDLSVLRGRLVVLAFDNDPDENRAANGLTAGEAATVRIGRLLRAHGIAIGIVAPAQLGDRKGIDDFVLAYGVEAFAELVRPGATMTLSECEAELVGRGADLSGFVRPRSDPGTVRRWTPQDHVDTYAHAELPTVTLEEARSQIEDRTREHWQGWRKGRNQLVVTATAGTGKTTTTVKTAQEQAEPHHQTLAVFLPSHVTIDEKINDGTLADFVHVYGRRWDSEGVDNPIRNCEQADLAHALEKNGYSSGALLCPTCPRRDWCEREGYKSQFKGKLNRAYTHGHLHSDYPEGEDLAIVDELTHAVFVDELTLFVGDIVNTLVSTTILGKAQRALLEGLQRFFTTPDLDDSGGAEFYETLERFYAGLRDVDSWGDGSLVQFALDQIAQNFIEDPNPWEGEHLPQQFGAKLFAVLSEDVRLLNAGKSPTGRLRLVVPSGGDRRLELVYSKGRLPGWYAKRPTAILNATGDETVLGELVGPVDVLSPQVAIQDGNEIVQDVTRNNAKSALLGSSDEVKRRRAAWLGRIRIHMTDEEDTVIITTKALAPRCPGLPTSASQLLRRSARSQRFAGFDDHTGQLSAGQPGRRAEGSGRPLRRSRYGLDTVSGRLPRTECRWRVSGRRASRCG